MLRCRRCRKVILDSTSLLAGERRDESPATACSIWHVNVDALPEWILSSVHQAQWTVGKLNCQNCSARLGGFDFIHHFACPCGQDAAVHLNKSRVDPEHKQCFLMVQPRMIHPKKEQSNLLKIQSQTQESECDKTRLPCSRSSCATAISSPTVASNAASTSENSQLFSLSPLYCISKQRQRSLEDVATIGSSCCCSAGPAGPADMPPSWLISADSDEHARASGAVPPQHDAAREASEKEDREACSLIPARRRSKAHLLLQQPLEDNVSSVETPADRENIQRASPNSGIVTEGAAQATTEATVGSLASNKLSKREKNSLKGLRRKQRKKERWLHGRLEKAEELLQNSEEEKEDREGLTCAVCLDIYLCPRLCRPCGHSFCEPCLRTIANNRPLNAPCPLCRTLISHTDFNKELDQTAQAFFPRVYCARKENFRSAACAKWPLPSTRQSFCTFWREQRRAAGTVGLWRFHHHGVYSLAALDRTNMHAGLFNICLFILYTRSASWILVFFFFSVLVYLCF